MKEATSNTPRRDFLAGGAAAAALTATSTTVKASVSAELIELIERLFDARNEAIAAGDLIERYRGGSLKDDPQRQKNFADWTHKQQLWDAAIDAVFHYEPLNMEELRQKAWAAHDADMSNHEIAASVVVNFLNLTLPATESVA